MKTKFPVIDLTDFFSLLTVWELNDEHCWELLTIERPKQAISLCKEQPSRRLVFPTGINPEGVWFGFCKKRSFTTTKEKPARKPPSNQEMVLALITASPGQSSISLALKLGITVAAVRQLLLWLEAGGKIHHRSHPLSSQTRLYYPGATPPHSSLKATASTRDLRVVNTEDPPLKVYFVNRLTLQEICKCPNQ
jgi:hypothetical protein